MADQTVTYNDAAWDQARRNAIAAGASALLAAAAITHTGLVMDNRPGSCSITVKTPTASVAVVLAQAAYEAWETAQRSAQATSDAAAATLEAAQDAEFASNQIARLTLAQITSRIAAHRAALTSARAAIVAAGNVTALRNATATLTDANTAILDDLERLIRLLWARGVTG